VGVTKEGGVMVPINQCGCTGDDLNQKDGGSSRNWWATSAWSEQMSGEGQEASW